MNITIAAIGLQNFHVPSLPNAVTGNLSATQGSTTVTGNFRSGWVNLGGYKINIAGTDYTVASTDTASHITLTSPFAGITGTKAFTVYPFIILRVYALQSFTSSTGELVQPGTPGSSSWYHQVGCSIIGTTLNVPQMVLPSTTDAVNPGDRSATWFAGFYYQAGGLINPWAQLTDFPLDSAPNPTDWPKIIAFATPGIAPPANTETYSKAQIDSLFHQGGGGGGGGTVTSITIGSGLTGNPNPITSTGTISLTNQGVTQVGTSADLTGGPITSTGTIGLANTTVMPGLYTNTDLTVDAKGRITHAQNGTSGGGSGTVTSLTAGTGLIASPSTITTTGTFTLADTPVTPNTYTNPTLHVDQQGRITSISSGSGGSGVVPGQYVMSVNYFHSEMVHHGTFWQAGTPLQNFYWDCWVCVGDGISPMTGYVISESGSGAHALLWGWNSAGVTDQPCGVTGNIYNGVGNTSFGSFDSVRENTEWVHSAVQWNGSTMFVFLNGICSGLIAFAGPRIAYDGTLQVCGSDHSNFSGRLAVLRGWEGGPPNVGELFQPDGFVRMTPVGAINHPPQFFADYTLGGKYIPDYSKTGFDGVSGPGSLHPGALLNQNGSPFLPSYVVDATAPTFSHDSYPPQPPGYRVNGSAPGGSPLIYDTFSRNMSLYTFGNAANIGSTEGGSLGILPWTYSGWGPGWGSVGPGGWAIFNGRACASAPPGQGVSPQLALVDALTGDVDVRVDRVTGNYTSGETGLVFRYQDDMHFWFLILQNDTGVWTPPSGGYVGIWGNLLWQLGMNNGGSTTFLASGHLPNDATETIRVHANGTTIQAYLGSTLLTTLTGQTDFQTATKVGMARYYVNTVAPRWDNFTVYAG